MKKQILVLVFLVVATFASVTKSYGQAIAPTGTVAPRPLTLVNSPEAPIAGKPYTYSAVIDPKGGQAYWYATKSMNFMTNGVRSATEIIPSTTTLTTDVTVATGTYSQSKATVALTGATSTMVTWASELLSGINDGTTATGKTPLFMVVEGSGATCTTSKNVKVIQIIPKNAFTIDLTNMTHGKNPAPLDYAATVNQCYPGIFSSSWTKLGGMSNTYGTDTLYFELIAANFSAGFKPTFKLSGLQSVQTADVAWDIVPTGSSTVPAAPLVYIYANSVIAGATTANNDVALAQQTVTTNLANTTGGAAIYIQVIVRNNSYEGLTDGAITLKVDAVDNSGNTDVNPDGTVKTDYTELKLQTLNKIPTIATTPASL